MSEPAHLASDRVSRLAPDEAGASRLLPLIYDELRRLAARQMRNERTDHTLDATGLVHEAYLRLVREDVDVNERAEFLAFAATAMRRILVDHARERGTLKRGGDHARVTWSESQAHGFEAQEDLVELSAALERLARINERHARVIELRFFGGLTVDEVACLLSRHPDTIKNDWRLARAWLMRELKRETPRRGPESSSRQG